MNRLQAGLFFGLVAFSFGAAAPQTWSSDPALGVQELERQWAAIANPQSALPLRGTLRFAVEGAGLAWHPERVGMALTRTRAMQDLDPSSATFGNFKWQSGHPGVLDRNAVEFAMQLLGFLHLRFANWLLPEGRHQLETLLSDGIEGLRRHTVRVEYTNIFVMKAWVSALPHLKSYQPGVVASREILPDSSGRHGRFLR
jgi:hypothetical protein